MSCDKYLSGIQWIPVGSNSLQFEYDARKCRANVDKHGIHFDEAKRIWDDPDFLQAPARKVGEKRFMAIGMVDGRCLSAIATKRDDIVRIISARRASEQEAKRYGMHHER